MKVKIISWLISHSHAIRMMKKLNMKRHASLGFYFEYEEVGNLRRYLRDSGYPAPMVKGTGRDERVLGVGIYDDYPAITEGGLLTVYRDIPHPDDNLDDPQPKCWFNQGYVPLGDMYEYADARRELGKWLNEQPNRPVDKTAIARLIQLHDLVLGDRGS